MVKNFNYFGCAIDIALRALSNIRSGGWQRKTSIICCKYNLLLLAGYVDCPEFYIGLGTNFLSIKGVKNIGLRECGIFKMLISKLLYFRPYR